MHKASKGWWRKVTETTVDISPRGEEDRHISDPACECGPTISQDAERRTMIIHRSFDGSRLSAVSERRAA